MKAKTRASGAARKSGLKRANTDYGLLFEKNPLPMWIYDIETYRFLEVNHAAVVHYGYSPAEFKAMRIKDIRPPEDVGRLVRNVERVGDGLDEAGIWRHLKKDGTLIYVEIRSHALKFNGRHAELVVAMDITARTRAEMALREKESLLSEAEQLGHLGNWHYDIVHDTVRFSAEMYHLFDVQPEEFGHTSAALLGLVYAADRSALAAWLAEIRAGKRVRELDFQVLHRNSEMLYIRCRGSLGFNDEGKPAYFTGTAQDITERKLADIQIRQQIQRLHSLRKIDQAITSSFDLRFTLAAVLTEVTAQLQVDAAAILLLDATGQTLEYAAGRGLRTDAIETARVSIGHSYAGRAASERRLVQVPNLQDEPDDPIITTWRGAEQFTSYFGVPLIAKRRVVGVLEVFHRGPVLPYPEWLDFLDALAGQAAIAVENARLFESLGHSNRELLTAYDATIHGWSRALDLRDREAAGHTLRVTEMTLQLARLSGLSDGELLHIRWGALLHDIGKVSVPDSILHKSEPLTLQEEELLRKHAQYAYDMLEPIAFLKPALDIPYCHHEKWDGTGYPRGLQGTEIPLAARLFAVVDAWDALTSDHPYTSAHSEAAALAHIRDQAGRHFDPDVVRLFFEVFGKTPPPRAAPDAGEPGPGGGSIPFSE